MTASKWIWLAGIGILLLPVLWLFYQGWRSQRMTATSPSTIPQALQACPSSPNCVCSQDSTSGHSIEPFSFQGHDSQSAWQTLLHQVEALPQTTLTTQQPGYLHAEVKTSFFGFVDDLEFLLDADAEVIHVRSASRVGQSDLGVNRKRVERLRTQFQNALK